MMGQNIRISLIIFGLVSSLSATSVSAHIGGHYHNDEPSTGKTWTWENGDLATKGTFLKADDGEVYIESGGHLVTLPVALLSERDQLYVRQKVAYINRINTDILASMDPISPSSNIWQWVYFTCFVGMIFLIFRVFRSRSRLALGVMAISFSGLLILSCGDDDDDDDNNNDDDTVPTEPDEVPANDLSVLTSLFESFEGVSTDSDDTWFYVSSNGLPAHDMMVGITNWQQQVPIDQDFSGDNRWQLPLQPALADEPLVVQDRFFRNAIAIAVNGVPIYHPLTNTGADALADGQLDEYGGHSGRADDYHYHIPPTHLESTVGADMPIGYALDGFPIYGETNETLDENLGRFNDDGSYQYHTISQNPYFIAGMRGAVDFTITDDNGNEVFEIIPQPVTRGARPSTDPLGGDLEITDFERIDATNYSIMYDLNGETYTIEYGWEGSTYTYNFTDPGGVTTTETYQRQ